MIEKVGGGEGGLPPPPNATCLQYQKIVSAREILIDTYSANCSDHYRNGPPYSTARNEKIYYGRFVYVQWIPKVGNVGIKSRNGYRVSHC